jgi:hypothetical protein
MGTKKRLDVNAKTAIANGWQGSGMSQDEWARQHGISSRTLRHYLRRYRPARHWSAELEAVATRAIESLTAIVSGLKDEPVVKSQPAPTAVPAKPRRRMLNFDD